MRYIYKHEEAFSFPYDVERIVEVFKNKGHELSLNDAHAAWEAYSDQMSAGWMCLPDRDDDIIATIIYYLEEDE